MRPIAALIVVLVTSLAAGCASGAGDERADREPPAAQTQAQGPSTGTAPPPVLTTPAVVPDVRGMDAFRAAERLTATGFPFAVGRPFVISTNMPRLVVKRQRPARGTRMRRDRPVRLVLAYGCCFPSLVANPSDSFTMPDVRGLPLPRALRLTARAAGSVRVEIPRVRPARGSLVGSFRVTRQWPAPGRVEPVPNAIRSGERPPQLWVEQT